MSEAKKEIDEKEEFIPMELRGGLETLKNLPNRVLTLLWKVLGWKGLFVGLTVLMIWVGKIPGAAIPYVWIALVILILFGQKGLEFIKHLKR